MTSAAEIEAVDLTCRFGRTEALSSVDLSLQRGRVHALLGPNGAGKTTLLRVMAGLVTPTLGRLRVAGVDPITARREVGGLVGLVPAADRSFYLRISGLENLVFFGRLHGLGKKQARQAATEALVDVGLGDVAQRRTGLYSSGMLKRLAFARALLTSPRVMLVDEATHDLDPEGAREIRALASRAADRGATVIWATQRLDELRAFADTVQVLHRGSLCFSGSLAELVERGAAGRYVLRLENVRVAPLELSALVRTTTVSTAVLEPIEGDQSEYLLVLGAEGTLGNVVQTLADARIRVTGCREERSQLEDAFLSLTGSASG